MCVNKLNHPYRLKFHLIQHLGSKYLNWSERLDFFEQVGYKLFQNILASLNILYIYIIYLI